MFRVSDRPRIGGDRFGVLMADADHLHRTDASGAIYRHAHPSAGLYLRQYADATMIFTIWEIIDAYAVRGPMDRNFLHADGSVRSYGQPKFAGTTKFRRVLSNPPWGVNWGNFYLPPDQPERLAFPMQVTQASYIAAAPPAYAVLAYGHGYTSRTGRRLVESVVHHAFDGICCCAARLCRRVSDVHGRAWACWQTICA